MNVKEFNRLCVEKLENLELIATEECGELIQAISKAKRGKLNYNNLCEEIADVMLCISWIQEKYQLRNEDIDTWLQSKRSRCLTRMRDGEFN